MEKIGKSAALTHIYYRSFLLLIVIPLVFVFVVAEVVIGYLIRNASIETIDAVQENIATALSNDVRINALQLSHFVYAGDGEFMQIAAQVSNSMPKSKLRTLTTFLMDYANAQQGSWQTLAAGIIIVMLPTILVYLFFQRYILAGVAAGAVKE